MTTADPIKPVAPALPVAPAPPVPPAPPPIDPATAHEGGTDAETGDRTGPGAGYDDEPEQVKDTGGVTP